MTTEMLKTNEDMVIEILKNTPQTRGDDCKLYAEILRRYHPEVAQMGIAAAFEYHKEMAIPSYESITRARRKIQTYHAELLPPKRVRNNRRKNEKIYRDYALKRDK